MWHGRPFYCRLLLSSRWIQTWYVLDLQLHLDSHAILLRWWPKERISLGILQVFSTWLGHASNWARVPRLIIRPTDTVVDTACARACGWCVTRSSRLSTSTISVLTCCVLPSLSVVSSLHQIMNSHSRALQAIGRLAARFTAYICLTTALHRGNHRSIELQKGLVSCPDTNNLRPYRIRFFFNLRGPT